VAHIKKKAKGRAEAKETGAFRRKEKQEREEAERIAQAHVIHNHWEQAYPILVLGKNHDAVKRFWTHKFGEGAGQYTIAEERDVERDRALEQIQRGKEPEQPRYSTVRPPLLIFTPEQKFQWNEKLAGVTYTVAIAAGRLSLQKGTTDRAMIHLGKASGFGLQIDPLSVSISTSFMALKAQGDAYISGMIQKFKDGPPRALLTAVVPTDKKDQDAGLRILHLWCDLLSGYGVEWWVAHNMTPEESKLLQALVDSGKAELLDKERNDWQLKCTGVKANCRRRRLRRHR
jgi:hypothetical protein